MMMMLLDELDPHLEIDLPIVPSKVIIPPKNYDAFRRFQDSWAIKLPCVELYLGSNGNLHIVKCGICSEAEEKDNLYLLLSGIHYVSTWVEGKDNLYSLLRGIHYVSTQVKGKLIGTLELM
jgi:hypothetical protein